MWAKDNKRKSKLYNRIYQRNYDNETRFKDKYYDFVVKNIEPRYWNEKRVLNNLDLKYIEELWVINN